MATPSSNLLFDETYHRGWAYRQGVTSTELPSYARTPRRDAAPANGVRQSSLRESNLSLVARTVCASPDPLSRAGLAAPHLDDPLHRLPARRRAGRRRHPRRAAAPGGRRVRAARRHRWSPGPGWPRWACRSTPARSPPGWSTCAAGSSRRRSSRTTSSAPTPGHAWPGSAAEPRGARPRCRRAPAGRRRAGAAGRGVGRGRATCCWPRTSAGPTSTRTRPWTRRSMGGLVPRIGNEADLAARTVAESAPGRPGDLSDFIYLSGEIGIGGAVVVDGRGMAGRHGWAGEIGHVSVDPDGPACPCGSTGCLERYAGKDAILSAAGLAASVRSGRPRAGGPVAATPARRMPSPSRVGAGRRARRRHQRARHPRRGARWPPRSDRRPPAPGPRAAPAGAAPCRRAG